MGMKRIQGQGATVVVDNEAELRWERNGLLEVNEISVDNTSAVHFLVRILCFFSNCDAAHKRRKDEGRFYEVRIPW